MNDERLSELVELYIDKSLAGADKDELEAFLESSEANADRFWFEIRQHWLTRGLLLEAQAAPKKGTRRIVRKRTVRGDRTLWKAVLGIAASLAIVIGSILFFSNEPVKTADPEIAHLLHYAQCVVKRDGAVIQTSEGMGLKADDVVIVGDNGSGLIQYLKEETSFTISAGTRIELKTNLGAKLVLLNKGALMADVAAQPADRPMIFLTQAASARIVGTSFSLRVMTDHTRLHVTEGIVRFGARDQSVTIDVPAGHYSSFGKGMKLKAEPIQAVDQEPSSRTEPEPDLLPQTGTIEPGDWVEYEEHKIAGFKNETGTDRVLIRTLKQVDSKTRPTIKYSKQFTNKNVVVFSGTCLLGPAAGMPYIEFLGSQQGNLRLAFLAEGKAIIESRTRRGRKFTKHGTILKFKRSAAVDFKIQLKGSNVICYVNGKLIYDGSTRLINVPGARSFYFRAEDCQGIGSVAEFTNLSVTIYNPE